MTRCLLRGAVVVFGATLSWVAGPGALKAQATGGNALKAGFSKVDVTPPPGLGLQGHGPEGARARGYRQRLYGRIMVLKDAAGETLAFVVVDLQSVTAAMHDAIATRAGLPGDRLLLSATHTHAAPSHYNSSQLFNQNMSSVPGFDRHVFDFLVGRIGDSLRATLDPSHLHPAIARWGAIAIPGVSRNRSYEAYLANRSTVPPGFPAGLTEAVDRTWTMLRVDVEGGTSGAFSVFGVHPAVFPAVNELYDSDLFGYVNRVVERHIDSVRNVVIPPGADPRPRSVHLWANGAEGDVSPTWRAGSRCPAPRFVRGIEAAGARGSEPVGDWRRPSRDAVAHCLTLAREDLERIGGSISAAAIRLYDRLATQPPLAPARLARAFLSLRLPGYVTAGGLALPDEAAVGSALIGGAEDGRTRYYGERALYAWSPGFEEGPAAQDHRNPDPLQFPKRRPAPLIYQSIVGNDLPAGTDLMVVQVGDTYLAAVPAEVTTVAAYRIERAVRAAVMQAGGNADRVVVVGLSNGYLAYLTTPEEYMLQDYEGAATLYGHQELPVFEEEFARLASSLPTGGTVSGSYHEELPTKSVRLWKESEPFSAQGHGFRSTCSNDRVILHWVDTPANTRPPADGLRFTLTFTPPSAGAAPQMLWDDDPRVEVRSEGPQWSAVVYQQSVTGRYVLALRPPGAQPELHPFRCP